MKKRFVAALSVLLLILASLYFFIPGKIFVSESITSTANQNAVYRFLSEDSNWIKWWPEKPKVNTSPAGKWQLDGYMFNIVTPLYNAFEVNIEKDGHSINSLLHLVHSGKDSVKIEWNAAITTSYNPIRRISRYLDNRELRNKLALTLDSLKKYIDDSSHLYGVAIKKEKVRVEYLVSLNRSFSHYPTTEEIYDLINKIKKRISSENAREEDYPMVYIKKTDSTLFKIQVAIPVNINLADTEDFTTKRMLKNGDILVAEITGGRHTAENALLQLDTYALDHRYNNIAIPFLSLVTDRKKEPDSTKWLTRVYYPVN